MANNNTYVAVSLAPPPASALPEPRDEMAPLELDVPMAVAAAAVLQHVHGTRGALVTCSDHEAALNVAAATLSWLVPVYTVGLVTGRRVPVAVNLLTQRFVGGATQLRSLEGEKLIEPLFVGRPDLLFALPIIQRAGLPL